MRPRSLSIAIVALVLLGQASELSSIVIGADVQPKVRIGATADFYFLADDLAWSFRKHGGIKCEIVHLETATCCKSLADRECDILLRGEESTSALSAADEQLLKARFGKGDAVQRFQVGIMPLYVIVNKANPVKALTRSQLSRIYRNGRIGDPIADWTALTDGEQTGKIKWYLPSRGMHDSYVMRQKCLGGGDYGDRANDRKVKPAPQQTTAESLINLVARDRDAIAFFAPAFGASVDKRVKLVAIDLNDENKFEADEFTAVLPVSERICDGSYPLVDHLTAYLPPSSSLEAVSFCEFLSSEPATEVIHKHRYFSERDRQAHLAKQREIAAKRGEGVEVDLHGGPAGVPLFRALMHEFVLARETSQLKYSAAVSAAALPKFLDRGDLLVLERGMSDKQISQNGPKWLKLHPVGHAVGKSTVGVIANRGNKTTWLTLDELRAIYSGKTRKWSGVRGADTDIKRYGLRGSNLVVQIFRERVLRGADGSRVEVKDKTDQVISAVALDPGAIGFVDLASLPAELGSVKLLAILPPGKLFAENTEQTIPADYPLAETFTLYVSPRASDTARSFAEFIRDKRTEPILRAHGLVPLKAESTLESSTVLSVAKP